MKTICLSLFSIIFPVIVRAQWTAQVGVNVIPVIARTLEFDSEFKTHEAFSLRLNTGYSFKSRHEGYWHNDVDDGVENRRTSGFFVKAGVRFYPFSLSGKQRKGNFYLGAAAIFSQYNRTAVKRQYLPDGEFSNYIPMSASGTTVFPAASIGFTHQINRHLTLDWGIQKSFVSKRNNYLGLRSRNYQPGAGTLGSDPVTGYIQGVLSIRYRFGGK